jgi:hypothetical protein
VFTLGSAVARADKSGEIAGFGGGFTMSDGGGTNALVGATVGGKIADTLRLFGEFGYSPLGSFSGGVADIASGVSGLDVTAKARLYQVGGGMDLSLPGGSRATPYIVVATGWGRINVTGSARSGTQNVSVTLNSNALYLGVGGGVRLYAGRNWGVKPEFRYQRYASTDGNANSYQFTAGVFYQFGGE